MLSKDMLGEIVAHAIRDDPAECCGIVAAKDGQPTSVHALKNIAGPSFVGGIFEVDPLELILLEDRLKAKGEEFFAIYHSHPFFWPEPSTTDIRFAQSWPGLF